VTDTFASATDTMPNTCFFSTSIVLWNCRVRGFAPPGAAGLSAQRGHVPFGLKEGRARCTTWRRFGSEEEKGIKEKPECDNEVQLRARDDTLPTTISLSLSPPLHLC
jgi:hypothetical protein